jgi:hypothetical protein
MKYDPVLFCPGEKGAARKQDALPSLDELKMEYLEYLLEMDVRSASGRPGIREISTSALARRISLFGLGGPPPPIVINRKVKINH